MPGEADHSALNKKIVIAVLGIFSALVGFVIWSFKQKADELKGPPITLTVVAELDPSLQSETITVQMYREGGSFMTERKLPSGTLTLTPENRKGKLEIVLPGSGNVRYEIVGECRLKVATTSARGMCAPAKDDDSMIPGEPLVLKGDTTLHYARAISPRGTVRESEEGHAFFYTARLQPAPGTERDPLAKMVTLLADLKKPPRNSGSAAEAVAVVPTGSPVDPKASTREAAFDGVSYRLLSCRRDDDRVTFLIDVENPGANRTHTLDRYAALKMDVGGEVTSSDRRSGQNAADSLYNLHLELIQGVSQQVEVVFKGTDRRATRFTVVLPVASQLRGLNNGSSQIVFKNITPEAPPPAPVSPPPPPVPMLPKGQLTLTIKPLDNKDDFHSDLQLLIDDKLQTVSGREFIEPVVRSIPVGKHTVALKKNGVVVYTAEVTVEKDGDTRHPISLSQTGTIVLASKVGVRAGVVAAVWVDGVKVADWAVGAKSVKVPAVVVGSRAVEVKTTKPADRVILQKTVDVSAGKEHTIAVE